MILRKPYAFLIKNFKKIHIILAITMSYILFKTYRIFKFFRNSAFHNYYASISYEERNVYVSVFVIFIILLIIASLIAIFYLLHHKKKPNKFYRYGIIFYIIILIYYCILNNVFKGLIESSIEMQAIRAFQDLSLIAIIPQAAFIIFSIITAIGLNIKKYNFAEDLKELEISDADREEIEINIGFDGYKTKRSARKTLRELKYYVKENRFVLICIGTVLAVILGINIISSLVSKIGSKGVNTSISNKFTIRVEDSIVTNLKSYGEVINNKYYVVVKLYIKNITNTSVSLDYTNYHLKYKNKDVKPKLSASNNFHDFAVPYFGDELKPNTEKTIALAFEIDKDDLKSDFVLKVYKGSTVTDKKLKSNYTSFRLKPKKQMDIGDAAKVKLNEELSFANSNIGNTTLKITNYQINTSYSYTYQECNSENICATRSGIVTPDYTKSNKSPCIISVDYDLKLDENTIYGSYNNSISNFIDDFLRVKYKKDGTTYYSKAIDRTPDNLDGKAVFQVDKDVMDADQVELVFTIRNRNHSVIVK